jgi:hypothetical protein
MNKDEHISLNRLLENIKNKGYKEISPELESIRKDETMQLKYNKYKKYEKYLFVFKYLQYYLGLILEWLILGYIASYVFEYVKSANKENIEIDNKYILEKLNQQEKLLEEISYKLNVTLNQNKDINSINKSTLLKKQKIKRPRKRRAHRRN